MILLLVAPAATWSSDTPNCGSFCPFDVSPPEILLTIAKGKEKSKSVLFLFFNFCVTSDAKLIRRYPRNKLNIIAAASKFQFD